MPERSRKKEASPAVRSGKKETRTAEKPTKKRVTFQFNDPEAKSVFLAGTFNNWDPGSRPLTRQQDGTWRTTTTLPPGSYQYRFIVDGSWRDDPECPDREPNDHGSTNCIVRVQ